MTCRGLGESCGIIDHTPFSPDLTPSDSHTLGPLQKHLAGKLTTFYVKQAVAWQKALDTNLHCAGIQALIACAFKWLNIMVIMRRSDVYHLLILVQCIRVCWNLCEFVEFTVFATCFFKLVCVCVCVYVGVCVCACHVTNLGCFV